jgi:hypothetical protein
MRVIFVLFFDLLDCWLMACFISLFSLRYDELKNVVDGAAAVHCAHRTRYHLVFRKNLAGLFIREDESRLDSVLKI